MLRLVTPQIDILESFWKHRFFTCIGVVSLNLEGYEKAFILS